MHRRPVSLRKCEEENMPPLMLKHGKSGKTMIPKRQETRMRQNLFKCLRLFAACGRFGLGAQH